MVCGRCRGKRCVGCNGSGKLAVEQLTIGTFVGMIVHSMESESSASTNVDDCPACNGEGRVDVDHEACKEENKERGFSNCDCQHRPPGSQSAFLQPTRSG